MKLNRNENKVNYDITQVWHHSTELMLLLDIFWRRRVMRVVKTSWKHCTNDVRFSLTFRLLKCIEKLTLLPVEKKNQLILRRINQTIFHKTRFISLTSKQVIYPTSNLKPYSDYLNEEVIFIYLKISTTIKEISKYIIVEIY